MSSFCQDIQKQDNLLLKTQFQNIDELLYLESYELASFKIDSIVNNSILKERDKLALELKKAKISYLIGNKDTAITLLLENLNKFQGKNYKDLKIEYIRTLGDYFRVSKDYEKSLFYYRKLLNNSQIINDSIGILDSYMYLGLINSRLKYKDSAIFYYSKVINTNVNDYNSSTIGIAYNNLSSIAGEMGDLEKAIDYVNKSIEIEKQEGDSIGLAYGLINLSAVYYDKKDFGRALENYLIAYETVRDKKSNEGVRAKENILYNLAYTYEELGDYERAFEYLFDASELTDSIHKASIEQNISEIAARWDFDKQKKEAQIQASIAKEEKQKRENAQLRFYGAAFAFLSFLVLSYIFYRNYRLKQQNKLEQIENESQTKIINATVDAKEKERKAIAETLHDSVSALLSSANLHLQATKAQLKKEAPQEITKAQAIVNEASVKIRDLSHELISSVLLKFGLAFAVHDMCQKYSNSEITLHSDDDGIKRYDPDFEIKIHNIVEELVNNILKHSKASNATIMLAHRNNDMLSVRVSDDGVGFNPKTVRGKDGLGLSHIEARIKVMKGVFNIISSKENGTNIFISVPIKFKEQIA